MQEILKQLLDGNTARWIEQITGRLGIGGEQASTFVQGLIRKVGKLFEGGKIDLSDLAAGLNADTLLSKLDLGGLAEKVGIDEAKAREGAGAILPDMIEKAKGGLGELGDVGDLMDKAKGMFGGLMG